MTLNEINDVLANYWQWVKDKTILKQLQDDWVQVTTPHIDRHNDYLQIYIRKEDNGFVITDDGYTIRDLVDCGCELKSNKRQELLKMTLAGFGVHLKDDHTLVIQTTPENFPVKQHNIIQAMLAVNDLFYLASPITSSLFVEDVTSWFDSIGIRYTKNLKFTGKSGFDHNFSFIIPKSNKQPERLLDAISNPKNETAKQIIFKWNDIREARASDSKLFALLNDANSGISPLISEALKNYEVCPVPWSERGKVQDLLVA